MNLAVLGEHWRGAARGHDTCAFIFVGTGIGAGILIDGELHRGHHFMAGEIAVMCMGPQYVERGLRLPRLPGDAGRAQGPGRALARGARGDPAQWMAELFEAARGGRPATPARPWTRRRP